MKKILTVLLSFLIVAAIAQQREYDPAKPKVPINERQCPSFVFTPLDNITVTPTTLVQQILGPGISFSNVLFTGIALGDPLPGVPYVYASAGLFTGGIDAGIEMESGIVLSSGFISNAVGPNANGGITGQLGLPGDPALTAIAGFTTNDATILEFDFVPDFEIIYIIFVFGSDEYNEYVGTQFNDVFAFFLNGVNIALVPSTANPITINTINNGMNPSFYKDNEFYSGSPGYPVYCNEMDGFTTVMTVSGPVNPNVTNHIRLAIADAGDSILDSWVFIKTEGFTPDPDPKVPVSNWALYLGLFLIVTFIIFRFRRIN